MMLRSLIAFLLAPWHALQREIDLRILWPTIKEQANGDLEKARGAFGVHVLLDRAWLSLGEDEVIRRIDRLT